MPCDSVAWPALLAGGAQEACGSVCGLALGDPGLLAEAARVAHCMLLLGTVKGVASELGCVFPK